MPLFRIQKPRIQPLLTCQILHVQLAARSSERLADGLALMFKIGGVGQRFGFGCGGHFFKYISVLSRQSLLEARLNYFYHSSGYPSSFPQ